jgi:hypothetical protein
MTELQQVYDLRDPGAWQRAHYHRRLWGQSFTDVHILDTDRIALVFRTGGAQRRRDFIRRLTSIDDVNETSERSE